MLFSLEVAVMFHLLHYYLLVGTRLKKSNGRITCRRKDAIAMVSLLDFGCWSNLNSSQNFLERGATGVINSEIYVRIGPFYGVNQAGSAKADYSIKIYAF